MNYTRNERKVLRKLNIPDFRHMTKDKVMKFASMLPQMDPEVAKKALEQFPAFKDLAGDLVSQLIITVDKVLNENRVGMQTYYDACNLILDTLKDQLNKEDIDSKERGEIEDRMIQVAAMIGEKDTENKHFLVKVLGIAGTTILIVFAGAASLLGVNVNLPRQGEDDYDDNNDNSQNVADNRKSKEPIHTI